jgi:uncharacterized RDD family membrane protein YckC
MPSQLYAKSEYHQFPKADLKRRIWASAIDFVITWGLATLGGSIVAGVLIGQWIVFCLIWLGLRVILTHKNQGQSLGHWALNMKVVHEQTGRIPRLEYLTKREAAVGFATSLLYIATTHPSFGMVLFVLILPIAFDLWSATADPDFGQTLHDRLGQTVVINTRRGFSLDLKVRRWLETLQSRRQPEDY